jgi:hypothetical protein
MSLISAMISIKGALREVGKKELNQEQRVKKAPIQVPKQEAIDQPSAIMREDLEEEEKRISEAGRASSFEEDCPTGVPSFHFMRNRQYLIDR